MRALQNLTLLLRNLLWVYLLYTVSRGAFLAINWPLYSGQLTWGHTLDLFAAGLWFDTTAILYSNAWMILAFLLPLHWKERSAFYRVMRWLYVGVNFLCLAVNLGDAVYFPFTGKRTTCSVFAEFGNESAGELLTILCQQALGHWPLLLLGLAMGWLLWRVFRAPQPLAKGERGAKALIPYYMCNTLCLLAAIPLTVAGMRGGFTTAIRPITISNANQYADRPAETGIVLNTPFALMRTMSKRPQLVPDYMPDDEARRHFSPLHLPQDTAHFRPMNVVVFILESFSKQHFGFYNRTLRPEGYAGFTPFLDSLLANGAMTWQYSFANGRRSIEGMPSVLSALPSFVEPIFLSPASLNHLSGLARELSEHKGYASAFFHGAENRSMGFQAFARSTGFQRYLGRDEYDADPRRDGQRDFDGTWAIWDEEFFQFFADHLSDLQQPFIGAIFSATSHTPYALPKRYEGRFPEGRDPLQRCVAYTDMALRRFFDNARRQPWYENTLFVLTADHTSGGVDPYYTQSALGHYRVPIILYAPGDSLLRGYDQQTVVQQADIMPTVLSYLHYDRPYIAFGQDMLSTDSVEKAEKMALHYLSDNDSYEYVRGRWCLEFDGKKVTAAYLHRSDSLLRHNVLDQMPKDTLLLYEAQMKAYIQQYMQRIHGDSLSLWRDDAP